MINLEKKAWAERKLAQLPTVEAMVDTGWRVIRIPIECFGAPFQLGQVSEEECDFGHLEVFGQLRDFETLAFRILDKSTVLSAEECLH
ncbi:MAG: hypothetical protein ACLQVD_16895 [Capsulimonadaceae bacterium]